MATFEEYGAVGDGITDDRDAIYNALNSGNSITCPKGATYYIGSNIVLTGKNINITGRCFFLFKNASTIRINGVADVFSTLAVNTLVNDSYFEVADSTGFVAGSLISITTDLDYSWAYHPDDNYHNGELHEIDYINGNKIYVKDKVWTAWDILTNNPATGNPQIIKVYQFIPITVLITGLILKYVTPRDLLGLQISYAKNLIFDNVVMHDAQTIGIMFHYCYNSTFRNGAVYGSNSFTGSGYGLRFQCCNIAYVYNSQFLRNWKSVEFSSSPPTAYDYGRFPTRSVVVRNCRGNGFGIANNGRSLYEIGSRFVNTHAASQNIIVRNNTINHFYTSFNNVGLDGQFYDNVINGQAQHVVALCFGKNYKIHGNKVNGILGQLGGLGGSFVLLNDLNVSGGVEIYDNEVAELQKYFIAISATLDANNVSVTNNTATFADNRTYIFSNKGRLPLVVESGNTFIGTNVIESEV